MMNLIAIVITYNTFDIIIWAANILAAAIFAYLINSYVQCIRYIKKRRKVVQRLKELRKMVERQYDFK